MARDAFPREWTAGCDEAVISDVRAEYASPGRHYHTWAHVLDCFEKLIAFQCANPRAVFLALLFHDAIYVAGRRDNEERSAKLARAMLESRSNVPQGEIAEIERFILATSSHAVEPGEKSNDLRIVIDIDMSILGSDEATYRRYAAEVMREWCPAVVDEAAFRTGRVAFLRSVLAAPRIFTTEAGWQRWESPARINITREIEELA